MVLRTAGLVAVCCLGTSQAFLAPFSGLQAPSARARTAVPMMSSVEVKAEPGLKVSVEDREARGLEEGLSMHFVGYSCLIGFCSAALGPSESP